MSKYIGIRKEDKHIWGNLGHIWVKGSDGNYTCNKTSRVLTEEQIQRNVTNGFLKLMEENE